MGDPTELVDRAEQVIFDLSQQRVSGDFAHIEALLKESFERITALYESGADVTGLPSGFRDLDRLTSGFQPGNLIIVAARPSMGKSAFSLCVAANLAVRHGVPVAVFTLEMSKAEVTQRLMCSEAKVESQRLRSGRLAPEDWPRLTAACDKLAKAPVYVDDTGSVTMMEIRSKARRLKSKQPDLGLIVVDYLQLMTSGTTAENRVQEVSQISRNLKLLARDLDIPILAMSQLSRAVEQRHDKRPILSDLRESGSIEQDADLVAFLYRDDYYNDESDQQGLAEVILAKHRNGPTDTVKLSFLKRYAVRRPRDALTRSPTTLLTPCRDRDRRRAMGRRGEGQDRRPARTSFGCRLPLSGRPECGSDGQTYKLHHIPSGILYPDTLCVLGAGCVVDPGVLIRELDELEARVPTSPIRISGNAHLVMPWHVALDQASERLGSFQIGTTVAASVPPPPTNTGAWGSASRTSSTPRSSVRRSRSRWPRRTSGSSASTGRAAPPRRRDRPLGRVGAAAA